MLPMLIKCHALAPSLVSGSAQLMAHALRLPKRPFRVNYHSEQFINYLFVWKYLWERTTSEWIGACACLCVYVPARLCSMINKWGWRLSANPLSARDSGMDVLVMYSSSMYVYIHIYSCSYGLRFTESGKLLLLKRQKGRARGQYTRSYSLCSSVINAFGQKRCRWI